MGQLGLFPAPGQEAGEFGMYLAVDVVLDADGNAIEQPLLLLLLQLLELVLKAMNEVCHAVHLLSHLQSLSRTEKSSKTDEWMERRKETVFKLSIQAENSISSNLRHSLFRPYYKLLAGIIFCPGSLSYLFAHKPPFVLTNYNPLHCQFSANELVLKLKALTAEEPHSISPMLVSLTLPM